MANPEQRAAWRETFVSGQEKLIAAERLLPLIHLVPLSVLDADQVQSTAVVEALVVSLIWGSDAVPQDSLEHVLLCVPLGALGENVPVETV
eukprot:1290997-Amphidinium_carterae.1